MISILKYSMNLQHTITGWPGGKPNADDSNRHRPERASTAKKKSSNLQPTSLMMM